MDASWRSFARAPPVHRGNGAAKFSDDYENADRYPDGLLKLLEKVSFHSAAPWEFNQFRYDIRPELKGDKLVFATDEIEISVFLKLLIDKGARVEVYSAHDFPDKGEGR